MAPTKAVPTKEEINNLDDFYNYVKVIGKLRTVDHAKKWTRGTLNMLGVNVDKTIKKELGDKLPEELETWLKGVFWPLHFRNTNISSYEFQNRVARRSGNSDAAFAYYPVKAVFGGLQGLVNDSTADRVAGSLSPELKEIWENA